MAQASSLHKALQSLAAELEGGDKKRLEGLEKELATTKLELELSKRRVSEMNMTISKQKAAIAALNAAMAGDVTLEQDPSNAGGAGAAGAGAARAAGGPGVEAGAGAGAVAQDAPPSQTSGSKRKRDGSESLAARSSGVVAAAAPAAAPVGEVGEGAAEGGADAKHSKATSPVRASPALLRELKVVKWQDAFGTLGTDSPPSDAESMLIKRGEDVVLGRGKFGISDSKISREQVSLSVDNDGKAWFKVVGLNGSYMVKAGDKFLTCIRCSKDDEPRQIHPGDMIVFSITPGVKDGPPSQPKDNILILSAVY